MAKAAAAPKKEPAPKAPAAARSPRPKKQAPLPEIDPDEAAAVLCKREFAFFVQEFWDVIIAEPMIWEPHMDILCAEAEAAVRPLFMRYDDQGKALGRAPKNYDLIINIPPGTSKSTIITVMLPVWCWINDPTIRTLSGAYSSKKVSVPQAVMSRDIVRNPKFQLYFPHVLIKEDQDNKDDYRTTKLGQRYATSPTGSATSQHFHLIILDDIINPKGAYSQDIIESTNDWMDGTISSRKVDKAVTVTILVMQRLATKDPTGHWLAKKGKRVRHVCLPASMSKLVKPAGYKAIYVNGLLSPIRMPQPVLDEMKIDMGSEKYAGQMDQSPIPLGGGIWKPWFIEVPDNLMPNSTLLERYGSDWDLAYTEKEKNSASAYVTAGKLNGKIYIDDIGWDWLEMPELIKWMKKVSARHYIEAKASGKSAKQILTRDGVTAVEVKVSGGDKEARARFATPVAESGIVFIRKSLVDRFYNDTKQGILLFPKAEHTDLADALAQCLQRLDSRSDVKTAEDPNDDGVVDNLDF